MRLCIAYPNEGSYSETFIRNHLRFLAPEITLTGGWAPYRTETGKSIFGNKLMEPTRIFTKRLFPDRYGEFYTSYLTKYLKRQRPDALLAEYGPTGARVVDACTRAKVPLVVHFHGFDAGDRASLLRWKDGYRRFFQEAKFLVAVSADMQKALITLGADAAKIRLNPYGVETDFFKGANPESTEQIALAVGRFTGKKAPQLTIRAFALIHSQFPKARLVMIGDGEELSKAKELTNTLAVSAAVDFLGVLPKREILAWHQKARLFVQHSVVNPINGDTEGTPNTILEASASGLPIVSTRHAGIKECVEEEKTGFLCDEGDYETMANNMKTLFESPKLAGQMGAAARDKMLSEYDMPSRIETLRKILGEASRF